MNENKAKKKLLEYLEVMYQYIQENQGRSLRHLKAMMYDFDLEEKEKDDLLTLIKVSYRIHMFDDKVWFKNKEYYDKFKVCV